MNLLQDQVVFITGAARGQGRAHAVLSAQQGADVVVTDLATPHPTVAYPLGTSEELEDTAARVRDLGRRALVLEADVRDQHQLDSAVRQTIEEFGKIDVLIANAGIHALGPLWEISEEQWQESIDINLNGAWRTVKAVAPHMIERQSGSIVLTSSINGIRPARNFAHYVASKAGVIGLMKAAALELGAHGIRCNAILPGGTKTPMTNNQATWDGIAGHPKASPDVYDKAGYRSRALKGVGWLEPEDMAKAALYLNSDLSAHVTGNSITVDGGSDLLPPFNPQPMVP